ncbi:ubiquinol-cytochrome C reductase hinge protein-domain-containing protein [Radiomyces spectabilis]|uniref:ubiquinol-cytochrome C reductase hinge protein-domain-containing protein n=1 Tax=Radiomyces spectabilis TaxID=64574 RepID=UPI00221F77EC|nr:ubiquinol-cytochrome C reductase hinge protein-domain-containing protein [Radiomyces spectabilis]KAI8384819.1 ubiquinol-cytochrome C reductase hinge protein-domain-containing protein [Radiomyces spectabilis]
MGLADFISNFIPTVYAEEAEKTVEEVEKSESVEEQPQEEEKEEEVEEEEEEEEEELVDPKEAIMEECANSKECSGLKHHLDECNERVENGSQENCIEEFFHFMHCADLCAAPKVMASTK